MKMVQVGFRIDAATMMLSANQRSLKIVSRCNHNLWSIRVNLEFGMKLEKYIFTY